MEGDRIELDDTVEDPGMIGKKELEVVIVFEVVKFEKECEVVWPGWSVWWG